MTPRQLSAYLPGGIADLYVHSPHLGEAALTAITALLFLSQMIT